MKKIERLQKSRTLPHSNEAEQSVLGCVLIDLDASNEILAQLNADDFYLEAHRLIFENMQFVFNSSKPVDFITLSAQLESANLTDSVGGVEYVAHLTNVVPSASNYNHYVDIVKKNSIFRQLISASQEIIDNSFEATEKQDAIDFAESNIFGIAKNEEKGGLSHVGDALNNVINKFELIQKDSSALRGIPTGFYGIDKILNGLQPSDLVLIAARPGCGKTSLAMNMMTHAAVMEKKNVAIFSLEMSKDQIMQRALCSVGYVDMTRAMKGELTAADWTALWEAKQKLNDSKIFVDEGFSKTPADIVGKCRRLQRKEGLDLVMIDYLQLMQGMGKGKDNRVQEISEITRALKMAARELKVPILLLSQLSRGTESRKDHKPMLSDLRDSGSIEQDADIVMFIYRPDMYDDTKEKLGGENISEILIAKHRNGPIGSVPLKWVGNITTFVNLSKDANNQSLEKAAPAFSSPSSSTVMEEMDTNLDDIF